MMMLVCGLIVFLGVHSIGVFAPAWRDASAARFGLGLWRGAYSLLSLLGLLLIVRGYAAARLAPDVLWVAPLPVRHLAAVLLLPVFPALLAAYLPGRLRALLRHPMLVAVKAWAMAHLIVVGTLAGTVLFGSVLAWAVLDRISLKRRPERPVKMLPESPWNDTAALLLGLALYAFMVLKGHVLLVGVAPYFG
jgi:uncharacterized membrane protein